jgi:hypothetical protein
MCKFGHPRRSFSIDIVGQFSLYGFSLMNDDVYINYTFYSSLYLYIPICEIPNVTIYSHVQVDSFKQLELCTLCDVWKRISVHIVMMAR